MKIGESIWYCKRISPPESDIKLYSKPTKYVLRFGFLNLQPASGYTNTVLFGNKINENWILLANEKVFGNVFKEGDIFYVDGNTPDFKDEKYYNGKGANAVVDWVGVQNKRLRVILKRAEF